MTLLLLITLIIFVLIIGFVIVKKFDYDGNLTLIYLIVVVCFGAFTALFLSKEYSCERKATAQGLEYKYGIWEGCLVKERDGNYIDYEKYRVVK